MFVCVGIHICVYIFTNMCDIHTYMYICVYLCLFSQLPSLDCFFETIARSRVGTYLLLIDLLDCPPEGLS